MAVMVAPLRGVNLGRSARVSMADVRRIAADCGYAQVHTYVQSGNLVFTTTARSTATMAETLRTAIAAATPVEPDVMVRTRAELHAVVAANPFTDRAADPTQLHVVFMSAATPAPLRDVDPARFAPEDAAAIGHELFRYLPDGMARSKRAVSLALRAGPASTGTQRNWRAVTKLVEMADETAAGG